MNTTHLTCMTYNIRLGIQEGIPAIAHVVNQHSPDLLAVQEIGDHWTMGPEGDSTHILSTHINLPHYHHVKAITQHDNNHYGHALLSRYPFEIKNESLLPQDKDEPRKILHVELQHPELGPLHIISTHLSWIEDRDVQGQLLQEYAHKLISQGHHVIIMGDLNEHEHEKPWLKALLETFEDADASQQRKTFPSTEPRIRIDYLLSSKGKWSEALVPEETSASDHFPVISTLHI